MPGLPLLQLKNEEVNNITPTYIYAYIHTYIHTYTLLMLPKWAFQLNRIKKKKGVSF